MDHVVELTHDLPALDGELVADAAARDAAADDFGHLVHDRPRAVLRPGSAGDIAAMLRWAGRQGWKVAARGQGHSVYGRSQARDGLVVDMSALAAVDALSPGAGAGVGASVGVDRVTVDAGATWRSVLDATLPHGRTPPVLTNFLDLSVGGTLSVGGIGPTTHRAGAQTDNVLGLEVVTGDGRILRCSPDENPDLFHGVLAGLGQVGVITRAELRLVAAPDRVRSYALRYPDLAALVADERRVLRDGRADHLQGSVLFDGTGSWVHQLEIATFVAAGDEPDDDRMLADLSDVRDAAQVQDLSYADYTTVFDGLVGALRSTGDWDAPHPWFLSFLPGSTVEQIVGAVLADLTPDDLGPLGRVLLYPVDASAFSTRLLRLPDEPVVFPFNLVRFPPGGAAVADEMVARNAAVYERIRGLGGLLYPVSALPLAGADWRDHFGPEWDVLAAAVDRFDPGHVLTPGQGIF